MKTVGIDASLANTGCLAYKHGPNQRDFGKILGELTVGHSIPKGSDVKDSILRIIKICQAVNEFIREHEPDFVVVEGPSYASKWSRHYDLGGLNYSIYMQLHLVFKITAIVLAPKSARKKGLGRGSAPTTFPGKTGATRTKKWIRMTLEELIGKENVPKNEHLRDALVLCLAQQGFRE